MSEILRCEGLTKSFGNTVALNGINLRLESGKIVGLLGPNGSGKTTVLNVIAETLGLERDTLYNRSNFFEDYTAMCTFETEHKIPRGSRIITSDDVFDFMLNLRSINDGINYKRE